VSILVGAQTRIIVQGITGRDGSFHTQAMLDCGSRVVGGVTPGKGGQRVSGLPVFDTVAEATRETGANCSVIFVPAPRASAAIREAAAAGVPLIVCITEGVPVLEAIENYEIVRAAGCRMIGPNCPGLISPGSCKVGIMPAHIHRTGSVGVISRSGTLTYEIVHNLTASGMGQSTCVGVGGDPVVGTGYIELLDMFERDPLTNGVVLVGEIGGDEEERAAEYIRSSMRKPVVAFISGRTAPPGKRMGHAGAIISGGHGTAEAKIRAFAEAGVPVADRPDQIPGLLRSRGV
jgi:succinyl-CoA synthetase alpha subunit